MSKKYSRKVSVIAWRFHDTVLMKFALSKILPEDLPFINKSNFVLSEFGIYRLKKMHSRQQQQQQQPLFTHDLV